MKLSALPFLACPRRWSETACGGSLALHDSPAFPARRLDRSGTDDDLREGLLRCSRCETDYPVLSGVAVLFPDPEAYFRRFYHPVVRDLERHGDLSPTGWTWLRRRFSRDGGREEYGADFRFSQQFERPADVVRAMRGEDAESFYGGLGEWLKTIRGPYEVLAGWAAELPSPRGLVVDAGCGVGGLLSRAAGAFQAGFGADLSFLAILLARRAVLHLPETERTYMLTPRCGQEMERPVQAIHAANAEFVVGDCAQLPFPTGLFDAVLSCNVIDIVGIEGPMDEAARLLRPGGSLLLSDPFFFRDGQAPPGDPVEVVRETLARRQLHPIKEQDGVPWTWATYDRHFRLYLNYCVQALKGTAVGSTTGGTMMGGKVLL